MMLGNGECATSVTAAIGMLTGLYSLLLFGAELALCASFPQCLGVADPRNRLPLTQRFKEGRHLDR